MKQRQLVACRTQREKAVSNNSNTLTGTDTKLIIHELTINANSQTANRKKAQRVKDQSV